MTILIAVAMHDAVVLMADGRRSNLAHGALTDEAEKITLLRPSLALAVGGAVMGTDLAEAHMRGHAADTGSEVQQQLRDLANIAAHHVAGLTIPSTRHQHHLKITLLAGGFDSHGAFLAGGLFGDGMSVPDAVLVRPGATETMQCIVVGGENMDSSNYFQQSVVNRCGTTEPPSLIQIVLAAGEDTVRHAACETIGGRIQYRVLLPDGTDRLGFIPPSA